MRLSGSEAALGNLECGAHRRSCLLKSGAIRQAYIHHCIGFKEQHPATRKDVEIDAVKVERDPAADLVQGGDCRPSQGLIRRRDHPSGMVGKAPVKVEFPELLGISLAMDIPAWAKMHVADENFFTDDRRPDLAVGAGCHGIIDILNGVELRIGQRLADSWSGATLARM